MEEDNTLAKGQQIVRENSSTSGKSEGFLFWVRENLHF